MKIILKSSKFILLFLAISMNSAVFSYSPDINIFKEPGCSVFPDGGILSGRDEWLHCCVVHDVKYWIGGSKKLRKDADNELQKCVAKSSSHSRGYLVKLAVRLGGLPYTKAQDSDYNPAPWRWGFGWNDPVGYSSLTEEQNKSVAINLTTIIDSIISIIDRLSGERLAYVVDDIVKISKQYETYFSPDSFNPLMEKIELLNSLKTETLKCKRDYHIISDFDDTIKNYDFVDPLYYTLGAFFKRDINAGIGILYNEMVKEALPVGYSEGCILQNSFTVLTASPSFLRRNINTVLRQEKLPGWNLILRKLGQRKLPYKVKSIKSVFKKVKVPLILIGDDTSHDHEAYDKFQKDNPNSVLAIYIHKIKNRPLPEGQIGYLTSFDIAYNEVLNQRLSIDSAIKVGESVLQAEDANIIPPYGHCPNLHEENHFTKNIIPELGSIRLRINERISNICKHRKLFKLD